MGSFGENLRREREMRGVTLEEISAATKISVRFLECVENEDFSKLPGGIFTRSFIRSYARYLGLDDEALLAEYQQLTRDHDEPDISHWSALRSRPTEKKPTRLGRLALPVAVLLLLVAGYIFWRRSQTATLPRAPAAPVAAASAGSAVTPATVAASTAGLSNAPSVGSAASSASLPVSGATASNPPPSATLPSSPAALNLQIAATERSWVTVKADGRTVFQGILHPDNIETFQAAKDFDVLTGNAQGVILTLNGQTLKPLGQEGEVKSVHLTPASLTQSTP